MENVDVVNQLCSYTHSYCEENIYYLLHRLLFDTTSLPPFLQAPNLKEVYAVFLSNASVGKDEETSSGEEENAAEKPKQPNDSDPAEWSSAVAVRAGLPMWMWQQGMSSPASRKEFLASLTAAQQKPGVVGGGTKDGGLTIWDYHVFALLRVASPPVKAAEEGKAPQASPDSWWIIDYDFFSSQSSTAPPTTTPKPNIYNFGTYHQVRPVRAIDYCTVSLIPCTLKLAPKVEYLSGHDPCVRIIEAHQFLTWFRTDRSHMIKPKIRPKLFKLLHQMHHHKQAATTTPAAPDAATTEEKDTKKLQAITEDVKSYAQPPPSYAPILSPAEPLKAAVSSSETFPDGFRFLDPAFRSRNNLSVYINMNRNMKPKELPAAPAGEKSTDVVPFEDVKKEPLGTVLLLREFVKRLMMTAT